MRVDSRPVLWKGAHQHHRTQAELRHCLRTLDIEGSGIPDSRRSKGEDDWWVARVDKGFELRIERRRLVVEREPGDLGMRRPIALRLAEHARKQGEVEKRRALPVEQRMSATRESQFLAQPMHRRQPVVSSPSSN